MTDYRRHRVAGGTYFFTVAIAQRNRNLLVQHVEILRRAMKADKLRAPFTLLAMVVLPDHLHAVWQLPDDDAAYSERWRRIKAAFSKEIRSDERVSESRRAKGERGIWQRRFWEHTIRDDEDLQRHVDYVHFNPVKHGYARSAAEWPHSTFAEFVRRGVYPPDWAAPGIDDGMQYGEAE